MVSVVVVKHVQVLTRNSQGPVQTWACGVFSMGGYIIIAINGLLLMMNLLECSESIVGEVDPVGVFVE
jgi:hypothetical protein